MQNGLRGRSKLRFEVREALRLVLRGFRKETRAKRVWFERLESQESQLKASKLSKAKIESLSS